MAKKEKKQRPALTRWDYFRRNLYHNSADSVNFTFNKVVYEKSEELQAIDDKSQKINYMMILSLVVMFFIATNFQNIYIVIAYLFFVAGAQFYRLSLLPKDIMAHLTDTGYRER